MMRNFSSSGGARSRNLGGHLRGNTYFFGGGGGKIEFHDVSPPLVAKILDHLDFFPYIPKRNFFPDISNFFPDLSKLSPRPTKIFHGPTKNFAQTFQNVIFFSNISYILRFCLSNSGFPTTFGHFSQKSPLCCCGSYSHGSQRLMISTEIVKNLRGRGKMGGRK